MIKLRRLCLLLLFLFSVIEAEKDKVNDKENDEDKHKDKRFRTRTLKGSSDKGGYDDDYHDDDGIAREDTLTITLKITNLSYQQPIAPLFVMVHNSDAIPIFTLGEEPRQTLQILAETGDPTPMATAYSNGEGVFFSGIYNEGSPWHGGADIFVTVPYRPLFPLITLAGMAMNTNDGFMALNGVRVIPGLVLTVPMYDAGSEINNEQCQSIPGPACPGDENARSGNGEGFVHVHRGIFGIGDLAANEYDWKNPVLRVEMMDPFT